MTQGRVARGVITMLGLAWLGLALAACTGPNDERRLAQFLGGGRESAAPGQEIAPNAPNAQVGMARPTPLGPDELPQPPSDTPEAGTLSQAELYPGTGFGVKAQPQANPVVLGQGGEVTLNFVNADVREVIDTVLGTTLKVNFIIDPRVQGVVTLRTARPVPAAQVIGVLEDVLAMNGVALVESGGVYKVVPIEDAVTAPEILSEGAPIRLERGFGLHVIPLRYASAAALREVVEAFVPPGRVLRVDAARNLLVFVGTGAESRDIEDLIATFDVDWMQGMSFALLPLQVADPEAMAMELDKIFGQQEGGALKGVVQFVPIKRLSAVLVITPQPTYLNQARQWVARLDRGQEGDQRKLYVYYVQNGRASEIADVLGQVFGFATGTAQREEPPDLAPGLTPTELGGGGGGGFGGGGLGGSSLSGSDYSGGSGLGGGDFGSTSRRSRAQPAQAGGEFGQPLGAPGALGPEEGAPESQVRIVADTRNNALVVYASPAEYAIINDALEKLDIVPLQVMIEATIAEVTLNDTLRYGVEWFFSSGDNAITFSRLAGGAVNSLFPGFSYLFAGDDIRVVVNLLDQVTDVKVISSPQLLVLDNETAKLQVGDQVPILTSTTAIEGNADNVVQEVEYRDTGVILDIIPRVNASGLVVLDIVQEVSDVAATDVATLTPTIRQRQIASTIAVNSGETIALGGLIRDIADNSVSGVPVVSEIPILGNLFKTTSDIVRRTELLVLLTPRVIRDRYDARAMTQDLRSRLRSLPPLATKIQ